MQQKTIIEVVYLLEGERKTMTYLTPYKDDANRFYNYYRPKIGNGTYIAISSKKIIA